jgi:cytochrome c oxidase subunit IV
MSGHVAPKSLYVLIFFALMVGTALTVAVTYVHLGAFNLTVALAIAITKAMLVILFFMHLKYSPKLIKVTFGASIFFFLIMVVITLSDYLTRAQMGMPHFPASGIQ